MTKQQVMQSLDYKWYQRTVKSLFAFWGIAAILCVFVSMFVAFTDKNVLFSFLVGVAVAAVVGLFFLPLFICNFVAMSRLTKSASGFVPSQAMLDTPHTTSGKGKKTCFTLTFDDNEGNKISCDTLPMFGDGIMAIYLTENYSGKLVDIAYNAQTKKVIVLGIAE